jgi:hypothetical protein
MEDPAGDQPMVHMAGRFRCEIHAS